MTPRLHRFILYFALVVTAAFLFLCGLILYWNRDRESSFYLVDAELNDPEYLRKLDVSRASSDLTHEAFGFSAHRVKAGHGVVIGHRYYSGGSAMVIDDESYRKLTIWLPAGTIPVSKQVLRSPEQAVVVVSSGGSAWPRHDCSGYVAGKVVLTPHGAAINVEVEGAFQPLGNISVQGHCQPRNEAEQFQATPVSLGELTPWQGGHNGIRPYDETYPQ